MQDYLAFFCIFCNLAHNKYSVNSTSVRAEPILVFFSKFFTLLFYSLTLFRMGFFGAAHEWGGGQKGPPSLKSVANILQWWNNKVIPYLKKIQKIYESRDTPWVLLTSAFFHRKSASFAISRNTDIDCILIHNFQFF